MKSPLLALFLLFSSALVGQSTLTVTNLNDSGPGSLRQQVFNSGTGDLIRFDATLLANGPDTLFLNFPIIVDNGVHISGLFSGADTLYISGHDSTQIFYMDFTNNPGHEVHLDSLVIIDAKQYAQDGSVPNQNGGAVLALGLDSLKITNSVFRNCRVAGNGNGGALYCQSTSLTLSSTTFTANQTSSLADPTGGRGGAIDIRNGHLRIVFSSFNQNQSNDRGGGIYIATSNFNVHGSFFTSNSTVKQGGAIRVFRGQEGVISECAFVGNHADEEGGAVGVVGILDSTILRVSSCTFSSNSCLRSGGVFFISNTTQLFLANSTLINNYCTSSLSNVGAGVIQVSSSSVNITSSTFSGNESNCGPGIIHNCPNLYIERSSFYDNRGLSGHASISISANASRAQLNNSILFEPPGITNLAGSAIITSQGHNIFSDSPNFAVSTDQTNIDSATLALEPLAYNGGKTQTMLPGPMSVALNMGNPTDFSDAQNGSIFGRRDIGAAERSVVIYDTALACSPITWWGGQYNAAGTYTDTAYNANSIDSVGVLVLYSQDTSIENRNGTLVALEQSQGTSYQWVDCANGYSTVAGATDSTFLPTANGSYAVVLTNGSCSDTSDCINYNEVGIEEQSTTPLLTFYPNPTSGSITLNSADNLPQQLQVLDLSGRTISTIKVSNNEIQLPALSKGIYLMKWEFEGGVVQVDRVVVE